MIRLIIIAVFYFFAIAGCSKASETGKKEEKNIYQSPLGKMGWYSNDQEVLKNEIKHFLNNADSQNLKNVIALILPHAGYRYSGSVAAYGIKEIIGKTFKRVIIIGPSHRIYMKNKASVPVATHYQTPLGEVPLDSKFIEELIKSPYFVQKNDAHNGEHSVQIEIPLLQYSLNEFKLVPIVVGEIDEDSAQKMGGILKGMIDNDTLLVVSSDFTHYGRRFGYIPFVNDMKDNLKRLDMGAWEKIKNKDIKGFISYFNNTGITVCGRYPISILLAMLPENSKMHYLNYNTSGDLTGDFNNSVSYLSAGVTGLWNEKKVLEEKILSSKDKKNLIKLARLSIKNYLITGSMPDLKNEDIEITSVMQKKMGVFVTLHKKGMLRGCIGEIFPRRSLYKAVMDQAINSAVNDYRFNKLNINELKEIEIEISALTVPKKVKSHQDIRIGKHGIVLEKDGKSAVYLPQVALEQGWNLETTLSHLSRKAGLVNDAWKSGAEFLVFEAIVFSENHL